MREATLAHVVAERLRHQRRRRRRWRRRPSAERRAPCRLARAGARRAGSATHRQRAPRRQGAREATTATTATTAMTATAAMPMIAYSIVLFFFFGADEGSGGSGVKGTVGSGDAIGPASAYDGLYVGSP